ncbi:MAG: aminotransferase class IV [Solirubrobacterales bacterium]
MIFDDGYQYGLGAFETVAVYKSKPIFISEHLQRLNKSLSFLGIKQYITEDELNPYLTKDSPDYYALKILVSEKNILINKRDIPYRSIDYNNGFKMEYSKIKRNNTSPLVLHKTLNYGECIIEKRRAGEMNINEIIFLNLKDEICEGTTCNIFFIKNKTIYTPKISCGILPGIIRNYICKTYPVKETIITPKEISDFDECFVTNSLMSIMPVHRLADKIFENNKICNKISQDYFVNILGGYTPL